MNFLKTTVEPCKSVVKKTRVDLFPNNGITISSRDEGDEYGCSGKWPRFIVTTSQFTLSTLILIWRYFLEASLERCAASFVDRNGEEIQHDRQQHVETKRNT